MSYQDIINFIKSNLEKGYSEGYLRDGLLAKNWPLDKINEAILIAKSQLKPKIEPKPEIKIQPKVEIKRITYREKKPISIKSISLTTLSLIGIFLLITFSFLVYFYMNGIINYKIIDLNTQQEFQKSCLYEDCHDLRDSALTFTKSKFMLSIILGLAASFLIVTIYKLIPYKNIFFWAINLLYFLFIIVMAVVWIRFSVK